MTDYTISDGADFAPSSAVSWPAVAAGVFVAVATTIILVSLGAGLGLAAASPWTLARDAGAVGAMAGIWLVLVQWLASAAGGYLTGRLRTRWIGTHEHEVFFRDTAHGFLTWSVATVLIVVLAGLAGGKAADVAAQAAAPNHAYDADAIYRSATVDEAATAPAKAEAERVLAAALATGRLDPDDRAWLVASAEAQSRITPAEAERRINRALERDRKIVADAKQAADEARKAASRFAMLAALSLVIGAFVASVAAALGGRERDKHP
jgi:hypothetical protein